MMKKRYMLLVMLLVLVLVGCAVENGPQADSGADPGKEQTNFDVLWEAAPEGTLAVLVNYPSEKQLADFPVSERLLLNQTEERFLLIPAEGVDTITIWGIEFVDNDFKRTESVYENHAISENFVLDLVVMRPEGGPYFQLSLEGEEGVSDYYIAYNGKEGNPNIEYITVE